jgi:peptidyl-prolyl cis-trans isomerase D
MRSMLQFMRKHAKNWMMKVILILIIIVFIFYFGSMAGREKTKAIATVGDKQISYADLRKEYENLLDLYRRQYGESLTEETIKKLNLKQMALNNLINQTIALQKAKELKIEVSNEEVQNAIVNFPSFQRNGVFDKRIYQQALRNLRMAPEDFEEVQKNAMTVAKLEGLMQESVKVSDGEVLDLYRIQNEKTDLAFIKVPCQDFRSRVKATNEDLERFLSDRGESFRVPERLQVKYLFFRGEDYAGNVKVSDAEVKEYYDQRGDSFTKKGGRKASLAEVKGTVTAVLRQSKALDLAQAEAKKARNFIYQDENFDEYAGKNHLAVRASEPFSKNNPPRELTAIKELAQYLGSLKADQITPVLSTERGFFIIKLISRKDSHIPKLAEIRPEVEKRFAQIESQKLCQREAEDIVGRLRKGAGFGDVAREKGLKTAETGFFPQGANIPRIGTSREIAMAVHQLSAKKPYPEHAFLVEGQYVILRFKDRKLEERDFEAKKAGLRQFLTRLKENLYLQSWITDTKETLTKAGKLKISEEAAKL